MAPGQWDRDPLARASHVFRDIFDIHLHWRGEVFRFQKSRSRVISLADYTGEKPVIMNVPHRILLGKEETVPAELPPNQSRASSRRGAHLIARFERSRWSVSQNPTPTTCRKQWRCPVSNANGTLSQFQREGEQGRSVVTTPEPSDQMRVASSALIAFLKTS